MRKSLIRRDGEEKRRRISMRKLFRGVCTVSLSAVMLGAAVLGSVDTALAGEQLGATDFDDGVGLPWHIVESIPADMDFEIVDGKYKITINNPGGASNGGQDRWDCQFRHRGLKIVAGHQYQVNYEITASNSGKYYTKIGNLEGNVEIWHNMSNGYDLDSHWDPIPISAGETKRVNLTFTAAQGMDVAEWAFHLGGDGQYTSGGCFPAGTVITFDNMSLIDLSSNENDYVHEPPYERAGVLTNQVGYFPGLKKQATLLSDSKSPIKFSVVDMATGKEAFDGKSEVFGYDGDSGDGVHVLDFTKLDKEGTYYIKAENGSSSREFTIGDNKTYSALLYDSLNYFYQNRSGIKIESGYITSGDAQALSRASGHEPDNAEIEQTWGYSGSSGSQDVTGGWYDAGDHGKYVVNGGISLWVMQNQYEMAKYLGYEEVYADGTMNIPENNNSYPDLLDEARWEMEWMFKMMVKTGTYQDMVYHKVHDEKWTGLGVAPDQDTEKRVIKPPTTAATLNVSACAAQAARLWKGIDDDFASECLDVAKRTYDAAMEHPAMYAPLDESVGGGAYGDDDVTDEFYWAAAELYLTTGEKEYYDDAKKSSWFLKVPTALGGGENCDTFGSFSWSETAALGTMSFAIAKDVAAKGDLSAAENALKKAADTYLAKEKEQGYGLPYAQSTLSYKDSDRGYVWGSNSFVVDNSIIMAYVHALTGEEKYLSGAAGGMDYILGRNPVDTSYVTGYGTHTTQYPHHRYWAKLIDDSFPMAPCGVLSGGPNSGMEDPWVQGSGWQKGDITPQKCYMDHIEAWSVNECTINWNAPLAWITSYLTAKNGGIIVGSTGNGTGITNTPASKSGNDNGSGNGNGSSSNGSNSSSNDGRSDLGKNTYDDAKDQEMREADQGRSDNGNGGNGGNGGSGNGGNGNGGNGNGGNGGSNTMLYVIVAVVIGMVLLLVISTEIFIYKMAKLKKEYNKD